MDPIDVLTYLAAGVAGVLSSMAARKHNLSTPQWLLLLLMVSGIVYAGGQIFRSAVI